MNCRHFLFGLTLLTATASAQTTAPTNPPGAGGSGTTTPTPSPDTGIATSSSSTVIRPGNPDPKMTIQPPAAGITPVVPPPGTGGGMTVIPK